MLAHRDGHVRGSSLFGIQSPLPSTSGHRSLVRSSSIQVDGSMIPKHTTSFLYHEVGVDLLLLLLALRRLLGVRRLFLSPSQQLLFQVRKIRRSVGRNVGSVADRYSRSKSLV